VEFTLRNNRYITKQTSARDTLDTNKYKQNTDKQMWPVYSSHKMNIMQFLILRIDYTHLINTRI
jgi:hypothetical protein